MAPTTINERLVRACLCAKHFRPARFHTLARALALAVVTGAIAIAGAASAVGVAASSVVPTDGGGVAPLVVGGEDSVINTHIHDAAHDNVTSVPLGTSVHPAFSVQGLSGTPTGSVQLGVWGNGTCSGTQDLWYNFDLTAGAADVSRAAFTSATVRSRSIRVQYPGDSTYWFSVGPCVAIAFTKATPTVSLAIHNAGHTSVGSVAFTQTVHAAATVSGHAAAPTNWFVVRGWKNDDCSGTDYVFATKNVDADGKVDSVLPLGFDAPGVRSYRAHYSGDATYLGVWTDCVSVTATKVKPTLTFNLHDAAHDTAPAVVLVGTPIHTAMGVTGPGNAPTGDIVVREYSDGTCNTQLSSFGVAASPSLDADQIVQQLGSPGARSWQATYGGDGSYSTVTSACKKVIWLAQPSVDLSIHDGSHTPVTSVYVGTKVHFRASVSGDVATPTGYVDLQRSTSSTCSAATGVGTGALSGGVLHDTSISFTPKSAGTVWFAAFYKGGNEYVARRSACIALKVLAVPVTSSPTPSTMPKPTTGPTSAPTAKPTVAPTVKPTAAPQAAPTSGPSAAPSAAPDPTDAVAGSMDLPEVSSEPSLAATAAPAGTTDAGNPGATQGAPAGGPVTPTSGDVPGAGSILPILLLLVVVLAGAAGLWFGLASRRRRAATA